MFLKDKAKGDLVEVLEVREATDPNVEEVTVRYQAGEERGDPVKVAKKSLVFPSDEKLPKCWLDAHYRMKF